MCAPLALAMPVTLPPCAASCQVHGTTRIPGEDMDVLRTHVVPQGGDAHVVLSIGSTMFKLPVQIGGKRVPHEGLEEAMRAAVSQASGAGKTKWGKGVYAEPNISLLTSRGRGDWAKNRAELLEASEGNREAMEVVEQALFCIVLVDTPSGCPANNLTLIKESFHGDGTRVWYDKCFSVMVFSDARCAWHYEHTYADAPVASLCRKHRYCPVYPLLRPRAEAAPAQLILNCVCQCLLVGWLVDWFVCLCSYFLYLQVWSTPSSRATADARTSASTPSPRARGSRARSRRPCSSGTRVCIKLYHDIPLR